MGEREGAQKGGRKGRRESGVPAGPWIRSPLGGLNNSFEKDFCRDEESPIPLGTPSILSILFATVTVVVLVSCLFVFLLFADGNREEDEEEEEEEEEEDEEDASRLISPPLTA